MTSFDWLPEELHMVAMRLSRADAAAEELARLALAWSRGPGGAGAVTLRQVERAPGTLDVEVASVRPVPPLAAMLFSEVIHHLRSAIDNTVFHVARQEHGKPFTDEQARLVAMPIYDDSFKFGKAMDRLARGKNAMSCFELTATLGKRIQSLQPFHDGSTVPSINPRLAAMMGSTVMNAHPLALLREYSNEDKHRAIRVAAAGALAQTLDSRWRESIQRGMREVRVGMLIEQVTKDSRTPLEVSAALQFTRPDGTSISVGPELDGLARHVSDVVISTLVTGMALPEVIPASIDLSDNGLTSIERLESGTKARSHERMQEVMVAALAESQQREWKFPPLVSPEESG